MLRVQAGHDKPRKHAARTYVATARFVLVLVLRSQNHARPPWCKYVVAVEARPDIRRDDDVRVPRSHTAGHAARRVKVDRFQVAILLCRKQQNAT